jgi:hypothetical protein
VNSGVLAGPQSPKAGVLSWGSAKKQGKYRVLRRSYAQEGKVRPFAPETSKADAAMFLERFGSTGLRPKIAFKVKLAAKLPCGFPHSEPPVAQEKFTIRLNLKWSCRTKYNGASPSFPGYFNGLFCILAGILSLACGITDYNPERRGAGGWTFQDKYLT